MLLLVYALVKATAVGWGQGPHDRRARRRARAARRLLVINELRHRTRWRRCRSFASTGSGCSNLTQLIAVAGFLAMFFFLTLYMQNVLHYSPIQTGGAYLPLCFAIAISAGVASQLLSRVGTRPVIVAGALIAAAASTGSRGSPSTAPTCTTCSPAC